MCNIVFQITPSPAGRRKDQNTCDNQLPNEASEESPNRSSSFLFDSMYISPLLDVLQPNQLPEPVEEEISARPRPAPSAQQRRRSELLANQEAEEQEAIQWGESSFNLSEWGDSLLVGEHFLERKSLLRHAERMEENQDLLPPNNEEDLVLISQNESNEKQPGNNQLCDQNDEQFNDEALNEDRPAQQGEKKTSEEKETPGESLIFKHPNVQNSPVYCSPGLQEIFDRWPSMSDPSGTAAAASSGDASEFPQPAAHLDRGRKKSQPDSAQTVQLPERPGSAGDLIPPTQVTPPVTPRVKLTTSSVQSPGVTQPLKQSTPSNRLQEKRALSNARNNHLTAAASFFASRPQKSMATAQSLCFPPESASSPPSPQPPSDSESSVSPEGFSLQLSQESSLCCSNSGTFSIIDVASDRRLFDTFIKEWKTKERFSIALACEKRGPGQQHEDEIGGKHKRGEEKVE